MTTIVADLAQYGFVLTLLVAFIVWLRLPRRGRVELLVALLIGGAVCLVLLKVGGALYYDPRPFVSEHVAPLFAHAPDNGFPSDHTVATMLVAAYVVVLSRRWGLVLIALSLLAGAARVLAHVHSPVDIPGALAMAAVAATVAWLLTRWILARFPRPADSVSPRAG